MEEEQERLCSFCFVGGNIFTLLRKIPTTSFMFVFRKRLSYHIPAKILSINSNNEEKKKEEMNESISFTLLRTSLLRDYICVTVVERNGRENINHKVKLEININLLLTLNIFLESN